MTTFSWGAASDTGRLRSINQDSALVADNLFAVADGMGGHQGGEVASQLAVRSLERTAGLTTTAELVEGVQLANHEVFEKGSEDPSLHGMGTTLCAVALVNADGEERIAVVNVGDSRVYLFKQGELSQLTQDHSLVEDLVRQGRLTPEEAAVHPQRNIVTRVLGVYPDISVDSWELTPVSGDRYLLCSDGLFNEVSHDRIASVLRRLKSPQEAADELVRLANEGGGRDNITCVVVDVTDDGGRAEAASEALAGEPVRHEGRPVPAAEPDLAGFGAAAVDTDEPSPAGTGDTRSMPAVQTGDDEPRGRRFTWRVAVFVLAVLAVLGITAAAIGWYARNTYYVGFDKGQVTIFKGRPGGVLWFDPTVEVHTALRRSDVPAAAVDDLDKGKDAATMAEARRYVANLRDQADELGGSSATTTTTTSTATSSTTATTAP